MTAKKLIHWDYKSRSKTQPEADANPLNFNAVKMRMKYTLLHNNKNWLFRKRTIGVQIYFHIGKTENVLPRLFSFIQCFTTLEKEIYKTFATRNKYISEN